MVAVDELYEALNGRLRREDIVELQAWNKKQPHLPQCKEIHLIAALHGSDYNVEKAKCAIDNFVTVRSLCPELFADRDPCSPKLEICSRTVMMAAMPQRTPEGHAIFYARLIDPNPKNYHLNDVIKTADIGASICLHELGPLDGFHVILDVVDSSFKHVIKTNVKSAKKFMYYVQEAFPAPFHGIHIVNPVSWTDKIIDVLEPLIKPEFRNRLKVHYDMQTLYDIIPRELLPKEIGGTSISAYEYHKEGCKKIADYVDLIREEDELQRQLDESKRVGKPHVNVDYLQNVDGRIHNLQSLY